MEFGLSLQALALEREKRMGWSKSGHFVPHRSIGHCHEFRPTRETKMTLVEENRGSLPSNGHAVCSRHRICARPVEDTPKVTLVCKIPENM